MRLKYRTGIADPADRSAADRLRALSQRSREETDFYGARGAVDTELKLGRQAQVFWTPAELVLEQGDD